MADLDWLVRGVGDVLDAGRVAVLALERNIERLDAGMREAIQSAVVEFSLLGETAEGSGSPARSDADCASRGSDALVSGTPDPDGTRRASLLLSAHF